MLILAPWAWLALAAVAVGPLSGTVVDEQGKTVEGAHVWIAAPETNASGPEEIATDETDAEGRFSVEVPAALRPTPWSSVWAYAPGARIRVWSLAELTREGAGPIRLTIGPPARTPVRVVGADGKAVAGARVQVTRTQFNPPVMPAALRTRTEVTTDTEGRAALDGLMPEDVVSLDVTAGRLVTQGHWFSPPDPAEKVVRVRPVGRIVGRIVADDPKALAGWTVTAWTRPDEPGYRGPHTSWVRFKSDESGRFAPRAIAAGQVTFRVVPPEGSPWLSVPPRPITLPGGESVAVEIPVRRGVKVEGIVREHDGGKPVAGVKVYLYSLSTGGPTVEPISDAEGRFSGYLLPGKARASLAHFNVPETHFPSPDDPGWKDFDLADGQDRHTLAPLELWRAAVLKGVVLDDAGKPVAGADVSGAWVATKFGGRSLQEHARTDDRGAFVLGRIAPGSEVKVSAALGVKAESQAETVSASADAARNPPLTLRLIRKPTLALRGRVLGPGGRPAAGVLVRVFVRSGSQDFGNGVEAGQGVRTGPDGTFRTLDEVPRDYQYRAEVSAPGMEPSRSAWISGPVNELPDVVLRRAIGLRSVVGRVLDREGKPVAGSEVFQSGDGTRRTGDTTDSEGRFRVPDVFDAPAFVFVRKAGFRVQGRKVGAGHEAVEIVVSRTDDPEPPPLKQAEAPVTRGEERAMARALIAPAWARRKSGLDEGQDRFSIAQTLAMADTDRVVEMVENQVLPADGSLLPYLAIGLYEQNPRGAVETLDALRPPQLAASSLLDLLDKRPDAPADLCRQLLTRTLARAREVDDPAQRLALFSRVADRWLDLGDAGKAGPILTEARRQIPDLPAQTTINPRGYLAEALARVDLPLALALLEGEQNGQSRDQHRARIAERIAAIKPAEAERLLGLVGPQYLRENARTSVCARMAVNDLPRALALAGSSADPSLAALLPAAAARGKAATDPAAAKALLAESFDRLERIPQVDGSGSRMAPGVAMARLLPLAVRIDPGRSSEYLWRAIAARPPRDPSTASHEIVMPQTRQRYVALAELAASLARYDRAAAEVVFAPVADQVPGLVDEHWGLGSEGNAIFQAAAAFDPRAALRLLDALPEDPAPSPGVPSGSPRFTHRTREQARIAVAHTLALPPALRRRESLRAPGLPDPWPVGLDDDYKIHD